MVVAVVLWSRTNRVNEPPVSAGGPATVRTIALATALTDTPMVPAVAALATSTPTPSSTQAPTDTPKPTAEPDKPPTPTPLPDAMVNAPTLNVRAGPGMAYYRLGSYPQGTAVKVLGKNVAGDWLRVRHQMVRAGG